MKGYVAMYLGIAAVSGILSIPRDAVLWAVEKFWEVVR